MSQGIQLQASTRRFLAWCTTDLDLRNVGKHVLVQPSTVVDSWQTALTMIQTAEWEDFYLDRQNDLSGDVFMQHQLRYGKQPPWNKTVAAIQTYLTNPHYHEIVKNMPLTAIQQSILQQAIVDDCIRIALTIEFANLHTTSFFGQLKQIYAEGHFPCGWNGSYPHGHAILF